YGVTNETGCTGTAECDRINYLGQDGSNQKIVVRHNQLQNLYRSDCGSTSLFNLGVGSGIGTELVLSGIDLPNGATWRFYYNPYGEIAKVILPTGGAIEYDHGAGLSNAG